MPTRPPLILLVGMHRSGTSLLGSLLPPLGIALPGELLAGDVHNPEGYSERRDVTDLQERLLIALGRWWPGASGILPLPQGWRTAPCTRRATRRLHQLLSQESERQTGPWAIKDPRSSLLLPLWRDLCRELAIPLRLVHAVRDPAEVMQSLLQRDGRAAGMTAERAQHLWWHHNTSILQDSLGLPRLTVHYDRWFSDQAEEQLEALAQFCLGHSPDTNARLSALARIRPEHRRSVPRGALRPPIHRRLRSLERALRQQEPSLSVPSAPPRWRHAPELLPDTPLPAKCHLVVVGYGATICHWSIHAWLQRCPLPEHFELSDRNNATRVGLHLQPVALSQKLGNLPLLRQLPQVLDPNLGRVEQLRHLGVRAFWIDPHGRSSGWLDQTFNTEAASDLFGLPDPSTLRSHGQLLCLGSGGKRWDQQLKPPNWGLPGFDQLHVPDTSAARLLAGWLNACNRSGLQLVRLSPSDYEWDAQPFAALDRPGEEAPDNWLEPLMEAGPMDAAELTAELAWRQADQPDPPGCITPCPPHQVLWESGDPGATAAVCISLFNYADRIVEALESVRQQTHAPLELIVVDDASTDGGDRQVYNWLLSNAPHFRRTLLLRHESNGGLASARNTAFAAAHAEWCFVLDADNSLEPEAVSLCLAVAESSPASVAVVHPLVELRSEAAAPDQPDQTLLTRISWQRHALQHGNHIDAMALVRRRHWQDVGGYTHIPEGWEDYDFWCKLIDAGLQGVICPQRLAIYNRHDESMQATSTRQNLSSLKRLLTARHPWLQLEQTTQS